MSKFSVAWQMFSKVEKGLVVIWGYEALICVGG